MLSNESRIKIASLIGIYKADNDFDGEPMDGDDVDQMTDEIKEFINEHEGNT